MLVLLLGWCWAMQCPGLAHLEAPASGDVALLCGSSYASTPSGVHMCAALLLVLQPMPEQASNLHKQRVVDVALFHKH
jgi:hypothetical protein